MKIKSRKPLKEAVFVSFKRHRNKIIPKDDKKKLIYQDCITNPVVKQVYEESKSKDAIEFYIRSLIEKLLENGGVKHG